jgi:ABC-2 type transport system ATP-binding protein
MDTPILEVKNLTKKFGNFLAVDNISFNIKEGEIVGLLGPNGAGKTTTIDMLLSLTKPTSGEIRMFGLDFMKNREKILKDMNFPYLCNSPGIKVLRSLYFARLTVENFKSKVDSL